MQRRLTFLVGLATISVALIIGLQIFWLTSLYKEQKQRFHTDVRNALVECIVVSKMNITIPNRNNTFNKQLTQKLVQNLLTGNRQSAAATAKGIAGGFNHLGKNDTIIMGNDTIVMMNNLSQGAETLIDTAQVYIDLQSVLADTQGVSLTRQKELMSMAMEKRELNIPFELAIVDANGNIHTSTTDTTRFKNMEQITAGKEDINLPLNKDGQILVAGFNNTSWYFLSKMAWLLALSAILIPLFAYSYIYVLLIFYRQKKLTEIRNDFINNMTHELKTPISAASVALELIGDTNIAPHTKLEYTTIAQNELKRLTVLVEKVLNMAAFEKNEIAITPEKIQVADLLQDVITSFKPLLERNNATVVLDIVPQSATLMADTVHFRNVIHNLLDNALKYNDKKQPSITINVREHGNTLTLAVTDNGKGIPPSYIDKVFDKFFRVPAGDLHEVKGYGLGLSYVQAVITLHKGTISAGSTIGMGSTFTITIPKTQA